MKPNDQSAYPLLEALLHIKGLTLQATYTTADVALDVRHLNPHDSEPGGRRNSAQPQVIWQDPLLASPSFGWRRYISGGGIVRELPNSSVSGA
jgi:hypothetical protein